MGLMVASTAFFSSPYLKARSRISDMKLHILLLPGAVLTASSIFPCPVYKSRQSIDVS